MHCNTLKQDNDSTVRGDGGSRVGEVRAGTTSPMPEHKGFKLQLLSRDPLMPADGPGSVSVIPYITTSSRGRLKVAICNNHITCGLMSDLVIGKHRKQYGRT